MKWKSVNNQIDPSNPLNRFFYPNGYEKNPRTERTVNGEWESKRISNVVCGTRLNYNNETQWNGIIPTYYYAHDII